MAALAVALTAPSTTPVDPARARGLRRTRSPAPCPPVEPTPLPAPVEPIHVLALLTRVRGQRVAVGELAAGRLYDVRAFKSAYAELGYLRRLAAAGRAGGTVVTSFRQLVAGVAALHPAWRITGADDGFEDRDRHHRTVRRRLDALQAMGLLRWRIGTDTDGEERRTELELRPAPEVSAEELDAAARHMERWQARYGPALNTGSKTGIRNAAGHGRPLSASERQRRGCQHARAAAASRQQCRGGSKSNSTPPFGAPATPENNSNSRNAPEIRDACHRTGVTRASAPAARNANTALEDEQTTTARNEREQAGEGGSGSSNGAVSCPESREAAVWDPEAIVARVRAREAQRAPVLDAIAAQATGRAVEVAGWGLERAWPAARLREAWMIARWGARTAADSGAAAAGPLTADHYRRLRRAVARYERNQSAAPEGYPAGGLAAVLHIGTLAGAGELAGGPRTLAYAVGAIDHLSRRMRAVATADSARRADRARERARQRRDPAPRALALTFRTARWPAWVRTDEHDEPIFDQLGMLAIDDHAPCLPSADSTTYRLTVRDAYLLAGRLLPVDVDGRTLMALRHQGKLDPAARRSPASAQQRELGELAHRTGQPVSLLARISPGYRQAWLAQLRGDDAQRSRREILAFKDQIAANVDRR